MTWDESVDVVVAGGGYAGAVAAIAAHDAGASVLLLERMPAPGGISLISGGGVRVAADAGDALAYLQRASLGTTPEPVLRALAEGMEQVGAFVSALAAEAGAVVGYRPGPGNYPFPGYETFGFIYVEGFPGVDPEREYPHAVGLGPEGPLLFKVLERCLERRGIPLRTCCRVERLLTAPDREVLGVRVDDDGATRRIRARRGVVLACGGFEAGYDLQAQYWRAGPALSAGFLGNVGDGIRLAQDVGADLWHMWHYHGSYGFKYPGSDYPYGIRLKRLPDWVPGRGARADVVMSWILVDKQGRRFTCEYPPYLQDTGARDLDMYSPLMQDHPRIPCWLVIDEEGRQRYPLGRPVYHAPDREIRFAWSEDNQAEVELGLLKRADSLPELATVMGVARPALEETIGRWNRLCADGHDLDFGRPSTSMTPIAAPPFYAAEVWPVVSNTQGGPRHDEFQRVVGTFGAPIPRLYSAGELGSAFGHLYMSGGNLAECFVGGRMAGRMAAGEASG